jgi:hypothetical protein
MKYFSSDFVALYNTAVEQYKTDKAEIDMKYDVIIDELIEHESFRLESIIDRPFMPGDFVETYTGRMGEVIDCPVIVELKRNPEDYYDNSLINSSRYLPLKNEEDEVIATCEGMIRKVVVKFKPSDVELDWGMEEVVHSFYPDELSPLKK